MNKSELVSTIAEGADISLVKAETVLNTALDGIIKTLTDGGFVSLTGFGRFGVKKRGARKVRNPRTGEEMMLESKIVPFFKVSKGLKDTVDS